MSEYIIVVNRTKKQYFSPSAFLDSEKTQNTLGGIHGRSLGLLLLDQYQGNNELLGSWFEDKIAILGDTRSAGPGKNDDYFGVIEQYEDIGLRLLALVFKELHFLRDELIKRAKANKEYLSYFRESTIRYGDVNMKYSYKKYLSNEET